MVRERPYLSLIENIWGWLKVEVNREMPDTIKSLKKCIKKHWNRITPEFLAPYFEGMPERMEEVIRRGGDRIIH